MEENEFRVKIKEIAVDHFERDGFYGATIRKIASDAGCSLPMIYYYYKSKKELFHEIIIKDYFEILSRQAKKIESKNIIDFYTEFVFELNHLNRYDKKVYRLGVKVYLAFDGDDELTTIMENWEKSIVDRHSQLVLPHLKSCENNVIVVKTLIHLLENLIISIVVKNRYIAKDEIHEEISAILADKLNM